MIDISLNKYGYSTNTSNKISINIDIHLHNKYTEWGGNVHY